MQSENQDEVLEQRVETFRKGQGTMLANGRGASDASYSTPTLDVTICVKYTKYAIAQSKGKSIWTMTQDYKPRQEYFYVAHDTSKRTKRVSTPKTSLKREDEPRDYI